VPERDGIWMRKALHDLCQPLTTLEGLLYLQTLTRGNREEPVSADNEVWQAIDEALHECNRMFAIVRVMQERLADVGLDAAPRAPFAQNLDDSDGRARAAGTD
jgi:hypothetical protein